MSAPRIIGGPVDVLSRITLALLLGLTLLASGCVVEPREGYYDRDHHRWYHEHAWHDCVERDEHCYD
jgi:hypothetical protein